MKRISLALGGGGTKGFAHIGVIKEILSMGYQISAIAGTSAGGIVGALFASGYQIEEIEEFAKKLDYSKLFAINTKDTPSLLSLGNFFTFLEKYLGDRTFESLDIPFAVCAIDNNSGEEFIINRGKVINGIKATTAVSGVFPPFPYKNSLLVDGGVLNPVPVDIARWLDENVPVIAVSLTAPREKWKDLPGYSIPSYLPIPGFVAHQFNQLRISKALETFTTSLELMMSMIAWLRMKEDKPDVSIYPDVHRYTMYDDVDVDEMIRFGENAVKEKSLEFTDIFTLSRRAGRWIRASKPPGKTIEL